MADLLLQSHPELRARYEHADELVSYSGGELWIVSSTRSRESQISLRTRWLAGTYKVPAVADPNADGGPSPWGWHWKGSKHMPQQDGHSHALDVKWSGIDDTKLVQIMRDCGLVQTVVRNGKVLEDWHFQWANGTVIFDAPALTQTGDDDMADAGMIARPMDGASARYPNGHPLTAHWFYVFGGGFAAHVRSQEQFELHKFLGAKVDDAGAPVQMAHDWFDELMIVTGAPGLGAVQSRP
jgi:hypothetical protein